MDFRLATLRAGTVFTLCLLVAACVKHPAPTAGKVTAAPVAPVPAPVAPPRTDYACETPGAAVPDDDTGRVCVPYQGKPKGDAQAPVALVVFSDFQCPYCSRFAATLQKLEADYPGKLRVYFRHNPLPFHDKARLAAQAAVAAENQGKLWEMHDVLFAHQSALEKEKLVEYAGTLGLDVARFAADLDAPATRARVDQDLELAKVMGVQGTPNSFINGRPLRGALPADKFKELIDDELARAQKLGAKAGNPHALYAALMQGQGKGLGTPVAPAPPAKIPLGDEIYKLEVGNAPQRGASAPKLTLIAFLDFQCPYCARAAATLTSLRKRYPDDLRIVFRHFPLPFHDKAMGAALAAVAAEDQGKFWEMHDLLLANQSDLGPDALEKHARSLQLNLARYQAALADPATKAHVEADMKLGNTFGVAGTPSFFVNGRAFSGAYPLESFVTVLDDELKKADAALAAGTPRAGLYAALTKDGLSKAPPKKETARPGEPAPGVAYKVDIKGAPVKGPKNALVTIVEFSDFQCPFCSRVEPTLDRVMKEYPGKVRVVWRNLPLPFHTNAKPAAIAAMAAHRQGKFWEMHALLFKNQSALDADDLEGYAKELGLDMTKFKAAQHDEKLAQAIDDEGVAGGRVGAKGTPAFFINGVFLSGAQPFERFQERIDAALEHAEELLKKHTPKAKLYDTIMKTAKVSLGEPETDKPTGTGKPVEVGNAPVRGPRQAPVTIVVFSDFQCPFCARLEPALAELD
jgi:protein-disulfide isomerase